MTNRFLTIEKLSEYLQVPKGWIYERTRRDGPEMIPHLKLGRYIRFNPQSEAFQKWLREHEIRSDFGSADQRPLQVIKNKQDVLSGGQKVGKKRVANYE